MSDLERIVVLAGGLSPEREVSLRSGDRVRDALAEAGIHAVVADADAALLSMLNACASGLTVVNIDNGFGAGYAASLILAGFNQRGTRTRAGARRRAKTSRRAGARPRLDSSRRLP